MKGSRILLINDEDRQNLEMTRLLLNRGYVVSAVDCIESAVKTMNTVDYDVIVVGMKDSETNGLAAVKEINGLSSSAETIFLMENDNNESANKAMKLGAFDSLSRSCKVTDLEDTINHIREKRMKAQEIELKVGFTSNTDFSENQAF